MSKINRIKNMLLRSSTMPAGTGKSKDGSPMNVLQSGHVHSQGHTHKADGSCCGGHGHDHKHDQSDHGHDHDHDHKEGSGCC